MTLLPHKHLDLAVVGNCEISALIDAQGRLVWLCLPRPDGDPIFSALLTRELGAARRGVFAIDLHNIARTQQNYVKNTAIVETILHDVQGAGVRIIDFAPRFRSQGRMFRPMMLVRIVEPLGGRPLLQLRLHPTAGYGSQTSQARAGSHHLRFQATDLEYRLTSNASISALIAERSFVLEDPLVFILGPDEAVEQSPQSLALRFLEETRTYWHDWVRTLAIPFEWQEEVIRAAVTLKLCTYEDSGAVLAALTTSIPESATSGRNWDYRYCWLRDGYFVVQALNRLGATATMEGYLHYIDHIVARSTVSSLRPVYGIIEEGDLEERQVDTLEGFLGMGPVRVGNEAAQQSQHDVYGAIILATSQLFFDQRLIHPGDAPLFHELEALGERAFALYEQPDAGPWEMRGTQRVHTFSAATCWAGCDRLARIAGRLGLATRATVWRTRADAMRERILAASWSEQRRAFTSAFGAEELDASVLLLPELGLLPPGDPRFVATVETLGRELSAGDLVFRYRQVDDFGTPQSAFTVCGFWYVVALASIGRHVAAREQFQSLMARRNPLGLLSEDIDPTTGSLWGNFPQTYSMVGIINAALRLSRSWEEAP